MREVGISLLRQYRHHVSRAPRTSLLRHDRHHVRHERHYRATSFAFAVVDDVATRHETLVDCPAAVSAGRGRNAREVSDRVDV